MGEAKRRKSNSGPDAKPPRRWTFGQKMAGLLAVSVVVVAGLVFWLTNPSLSPIDDLPRASANAPAFPSQFDRHGVSVGDPDAPVVVREFSDYQCPACARFAPIMERFKRDYVETGKARVVFFNFPLPGHDNAFPSAIAARCAGDQQEYWSMHGMIFDNQSRWSAANDPQAEFTRYARRLGLDAELFERCLRTERHRQVVQRNLEVVGELGVRSTPTVFVDNIQLTQPGWFQLSGVVENQLKEE